MIGAARAPWRLTVYPSLPSTSALCCARAADGEPEGLAVLALQQTEGRGSRGRAWSSPPGNLSLSVILRPDTPAARAGQWALLAGVAMAQGLAGFLPDASSLALKWPNDILLHGKKLGGILVESSAGQGGRIDWLVIGFGANLAEAPVLPDRPAVAALAEVGAAPTPEAAAATILDRLDHWRRIWRQDGFGAVRMAWMQFTQPIGSRLNLRLRDGDVQGQFAGLTDDGGLLLQTAGGVRAYATGEVLLGGADGACIRWPSATQGLSDYV